MFQLLMRGKGDRLSTSILNFLAEASEPLETKEIELLLPKETRIKIFYRLNLLRGDGMIKGKAVGSGKGCWIWWNTPQSMDGKTSGTISYGKK